MNYRKYVEQEKAAGRKPASLKEWAASRTSEAEEHYLAPDPNPGIEEDPEDEVVVSGTIQIPTLAQPEPEPEEPERLIFYSVNRFRVETMQAGQKMYVNNQIVVMPHRQITFSEHYWSPDPYDQDQVEKAAWLKERVDRGVYNGEILIVPEAVTHVPVGIQTGPRTATPNTSPRVDRPAGPLSVTIPE